MDPKNRPLWEPATRRQLDYLADLSDPYAEPIPPLTIRAVLPDPADLNALSKQEAGFWIEQARGENVKGRRPAPARHADRIEGNAANLPTVQQMALIRHTLREMEWKRDRYRPFIQRATSGAAEELRELDRMNARKVIAAMMATKKHFYRLRN
jgi:hypothetical protein